MLSKKINNISSILSILGAISSIFSLFKIRKYYKRIIEINDLEKLTFINNDVERVREIYEDIRNYYITQNKRGIKMQKIVGQYAQIRNHLNNIRKEMPSRYKDVLDLIMNANKQIDIIDTKGLHHEKNDCFQELGIYLMDIEDRIKLEKENIRGF